MPGWISFLPPAAALFAALAPQAATGAQATALEYTPAVVDNPLKGLVPYAGDRAGVFPHSMEFGYLPLSSAVKGDGAHDWAALDALLSGIAARGHQAIFRFFLEYPGKSHVIPEYLLKRGLKVHRYENTNTHPFPPKDVETPDYTDPNLRACLRGFIAALGARYDGDPRVGFITAGLLGTWGEWHTHPRNDLWAPKDVQAEVLDAYEAAFNKTPILLRYPAAQGDPSYAPTAGRPFGYHDDSFAWATLDTGRKADAWFFMAKMNRGGPALADTWKKFPIGGEIRPEAWGIVFDENPAAAQVQDFAECVRTTHATWLMDSGMFKARAQEPRLSRAMDQVRKMGYEFHIPSVTVGIEDSALRVTAEVENRGVAPFYHDWTVEYALIAAGGRIERSWPGKGKFTGILPGDPPSQWAETLDVRGMAPGPRTLTVRGANPMPGGHPIRFANKTQDKDADGWLTLTTVLLP